MCQEGFASLDVVEEPNFMRQSGQNVIFSSKLFSLIFPKFSKKKKGLCPLYLVWLYPSTLINRAINRFDLADYTSLFNSLASVS